MADHTDIIAAPDPATPAAAPACARHMPAFRPIYTVDDAVLVVSEIASAIEVIYDLISEADLGTSNDDRIGESAALLIMAKGSAAFAVNAIDRLPSARGAA